MSLDTWLVTGGGGLLGSNAAAFLQHRAHAVGLARGPVHASFAGSIRADLRQSDLVRAEVDRVRPHVIFHAAALARHEDCERDPELARAVNVDATAILAQAARDVGAVFVYVSTDAVFDGSEGHYSEEDSPSPFSVYGRTKLEGEEATLSAGGVVVRTNFFGWSPTGDRSILEFFVRELEAGRSVPGYINFIVTSLYAQHLLDAVWQLVDREARGIFHAASRDARSKLEFGLAVAEEFGLDPTLVVPVHASVGSGPHRGNRDISLDVTRIQRTLDWQAPSQANGLAQAHADAQLRRVAAPLRAASEMATEMPEAESNAPFPRRP